MASILDYIKKNSNNFKEEKFNEIDNVVFSKFVYLKFENILEFEDTISIKELYLEYRNKEHEEMDKDIINFFALLAKSRRYSSLMVGNYSSIVSSVSEKQFGAITIYLPDNLMYISFRGTDNTLIGLKEDFNMTYLSFFSSQRDAVKYLEKVMRRNKCKAIVGGHSKGGNLAMYASLFCKNKFKKRIIKIYNNDGPGFFDEVIESPAYKKSVDKIMTFVPQTSIIGMLLTHKEKYTVIKSRKILIMQHDLLSWEIDGNRLKKIKSVDNKSKYIDSIMSELLKIPKDDRKRFFDILYQILISTGAKTVDELSQKKLKNIKGIIGSYKRLNEEEKTLLINIWKEIIRVAKINAALYLPKLKKEKEKIK